MAQGGALAHPECVSPNAWAKRCSGGAIVNVVGMGSKLASPTYLPGGAANATLILASAGLANAFAAQGVRVNPGLTATERMQQGFEAEAEAGSPAQEIVDQRLRVLPLGRSRDAACSMY